MVKHHWLSEIPPGCLVDHLRTKTIIRIRHSWENNQDFWRVVHGLNRGVYSRPSPIGHGPGDVVWTRTNLKVIQWGVCLKPSSHWSGPRWCGLDKDQSKTLTLRCFFEPSSHWSWPRWCCLDQDQLKCLTVRCLFDALFPLVLAQVMLCRPRSIIQSYREVFVWGPPPIGPAPGNAGWRIGAPGYTPEVKYM